MDTSNRSYQRILLLSAAVFFCCALAWGAGPTEQQKDTLRQIIRERRAMEEAQAGDRPVYHFTPRKNWMNDPNGLVYADGIWHMFFQYDPRGKYGSQKAWGHAVSADLVRWKELEVALPKKEYNMYSGTAALDIPNTLGKNTPEHTAMIIAVTEFLNGQCIYYSADGGVTFNKMQEEPVIPLKGSSNRDPKLFWYDKGRYWVMAYYSEAPEVAPVPSYVFYRSEDLKNWEYMTYVPGCYECPDVRQIPVEGASETKWTVLCGNMDYMVGDFDGRRFIPSQKKDRTLRMYGNYASQTWSDAPGGRVVQISWMPSPTEEQRPFSQQMGFPVDLTLRKTEDGCRLIHRPVKEIEKLWRKTYEFGPSLLEPGKNLFEGIEGTALDIEIEFEYDPFVYFVNLNTPNGTVQCTGIEPAVKAMGQIQYADPGKTMKLRVLTDTDSMEIFGNDGEIYMPFIAKTRDRRLSLDVHLPVKLIRARVSVMGP